MLRKLKILILPAALIFIGATFTGAYFSDSVSVSGNNFSAGTWEAPTTTPADIVLNEFMANPSGPEPDGEWIELYNKGGSSIDINGWVLYDAIDSHSLLITPTNVVGGSTAIGASSYLVVDYQLPSTFSLNNTGTETLRLYDGLIGTGSLKDNITYSGTVEDKTGARLPDGTGGWTNNHTPTLGGPNV